MRLLIAISTIAFALVTLAACGPGDKMKYVCNLQWTCDEVTEEKVEHVCLDEDNPDLCSDLLKDLEGACDGNLVLSNKACICEGVTAHSCPSN